MLSFFMGEYLSRIGWIIFHLKETASWFFEVGGPFYSLISSVWVFSYSTSSPTFRVLSLFFILVILIGVKWYLIVVLICTSLKPKDIEHPVMWGEPGHEVCVHIPVVREPAEEQQWEGGKKCQHRCPPFVASTAPQSAYTHPMSGRPREGPQIPSVVSPISPRPGTAQEGWNKSASSPPGLQAYQEGSNTLYQLGGKPSNRVAS